MSVRRARILSSDSSGEDERQIKRTRFNAEEDFERESITAEEGSIVLPSGTNRDDVQSDSEEEEVVNVPNEQFRDQPETEPHERSEDLPDDEHARKSGEDIGNDSNNEQENDENTSGKVKKKKVVRNPQPKLDAVRLTGERGILQLKSMQKYLHLKDTKKSEEKALKEILHNLQVWGHRLFPKMQTKDIYKRCQRIGTKMPLKVYLKKMRMGLHNELENNMIHENSDEDNILRNNHPERTDDDINPTASMQQSENDAEFESLFGNTNKSPEELPPTANTEEEKTTEDQPVEDEVRASIEDKRQAALRRREELKLRRISEIASIEPQSS